jgi:hypothetical protein
MSKRNDLIKHNEHTAKYARKENDAQPFLMIFPQEIVFLIMIFMDMHTLDNFLLTCQTISGWFRTKQLYDTWKMDKLMQATDRIFNVLHNYPKGVGEVIIDLVKKENGVVAGGFVLQFISNTTFENTSIDIYIPCDISENEEEAIKNTTNCSSSHSLATDLDHRSFSPKPSAVSPIALPRQQTTPQSLTPQHAKCVEYLATLTTWSSETADTSWRHLSMVSQGLSIEDMTVQDWP